MTDLRTELQTIYERHGTLTPELVVTEATNPNHPLHDRFEWDNDTAGEQWRREQAHRLITSIKVVYRQATETEDSRTIRAFHAVRRDNGHVYEPADRVAGDEFVRQLVLNDMAREWKQLHRRYRHFSEFVDMVKAEVESNAA